MSGSGALHFVGVPHVVVVVTRITYIDVSSDGQSILSGRYAYRTQDNLGNSETISGNISRYDDQWYIEGDFTQSLEYAIQLRDSPPDYHLLFNNCSTLALIILRVSASPVAQQRIDSCLEANYVNPIPLKRKKILMPNIVATLIKDIFPKK